MQNPTYAAFQPANAIRHALPAANASPQASFDRLVRLAAALFDMPLACISLVDEEQEWIKARYGIEHDLAPIDCAHSFACHALRGVRPLMLDEPARDPRFADHPLVAAARPIRFAASMPLQAGGYFPAGALSLFDYQPRTLDKTQLRALRDLAVLAEELLRQKQAALEGFNTHDVLTGLPNRMLLMDLLQRATLRWEQEQRQATVALVNLDHFKDLNDALGHAAGDQALAAIARRLLDAVRQSDTVARIGGDEFIIILEQLDDDEQPRQVLQRVMEKVEQSLTIGAHEVALGCSIGFSHYPQDGDNADALLNTANAAMRRAKEIGRSTVQHFTRDIGVRASRRLTLESSLRRAVQRNELLLHYQPKANLRSGAICGVEALIRWRHPQLGLMPPSHFITIAEESGLIVPIGEWILHTACRQIRAWKDAGLEQVPIAVNLSTRQFLQPDIAGIVSQAMQASGVGPGCLELEITESMSMSDPEKSIATMQSLRELGVSLSIDDFGTGYSSLSYLKRFPIDKLKIDRSFVSDITHSSEGLAIIQAVIAMAHRLNLKVVAEGVETERQLSFLAINLCDQMQGFYFSKPLPERDCTALLQSGERLRVDEKAKLALAALFGSR
jgi:diguanylate cyclase (GGDEF)-like protein